MRQIFLVAAWGLVVWGGTLDPLPRATAASPAPAAVPTSVLPVVTRAPGGARLYHSPLAPYVVASGWPAHPIPDPEAPYDLFDGGTAQIAVLTELNKHHLDTPGAEQRLRTLIIQGDMTPFLMSRLAVGGQPDVALLAFSGPDGVFAAATFVTAGRVWTVQLSSTYPRQEQDWRVLRRFLASVRLEHPSVASWQ